MPSRSATGPITMPPSPVPSQVSALASATSWRAVPRSSVIGFNPTTASSVEPKMTVKRASVTQAAIHDWRDSMLGVERCAIAAPGAIAADVVSTNSVTARPLPRLICPVFDQIAGV